ncbi:putative reverse transcriptase domain-containing protein [Tanacetum coccineum]
MAPKRTTRSTPVTTTPAPTATTTTSVTNAQLQAMIDQGVTAALAARDANRNGDDSHTSGTGGRRTERVVRECTYQDFMKCKPLYFKGTEGVVELINAMCSNMVDSHVMTVSHDACICMEVGDLRKEDDANIKAENTMQGRLLNIGHELNQWIKKVQTPIAERQAEYKRKFGKHFPKTIKPINNRTRYRKIAAHNTVGTGHYKRECPKLKNNKNRGNQVGNDRAPAKVYAVGRAGTNPTHNVRVVHQSWALPEGARDFDRIMRCFKEGFFGRTHGLGIGAVVFALKVWRALHCIGTKCSVFFTDHKSLQHILNQKELNMRQRRWLDLLSDYDCEIRYHPGKANVVAV